MCKKAFKTKKEQKEHEETHKESPDEAGLTCISCDKRFQSSHSLKQHMESKHKNTDNRPDGNEHTETQNNEMPQNIACVKCNKVFATGSEIDEHMKEHVEGNQKNFESPNQNKICRHFRNGFCFKGDQCVFKHSKSNQNSIPACRRGPQCIFWYQNRCKFFHYGAQNPPSFEGPRACKFGEECWNIASCVFSHPEQGFRFAKRTTRPPQGFRNMNQWMDY